MSKHVGCLLSKHAGCLLKTDFLAKVFVEILAGVSIVLPAQEDRGEVNLACRGDLQFYLFLWREYWMEDNFTFEQGGREGGRDGGVFCALVWLFIYGNFKISMVTL